MKTCIPNIKYTFLYFQMVVTFLYNSTTLRVSGLQYTCSLRPGPSDIRDLMLHQTPAPLPPHASPSENWTYNWPRKTYFLIQSADSADSKATTPRAARSRSREALWGAGLFAHSRTCLFLPSLRATTSQGPAGPDLDMQTGPWCPPELLSAPPSEQNKNQASSSELLWLRQRSRSADPGQKRKAGWEKKTDNYLGKKLKAGISWRCGCSTGGPSAVAVCVRRALTALRWLETGDGPRVINVLKAPQARGAHCHIS